MVSILRLERVIKELTQAELASRTGIPQWRISLLERGKAANDDERQRLAAALSVTPGALWPGQEAQP
jgi:transcriptional regulator with XRE-family HTH domain